MKNFMEVARLVFVLSFSMYVGLHFANADFGVSEFVPKYLPYPYFWNYFTGVCILCFVVSGLIGKYDKLGAILMAFYIALVIVLIHLPKAATNAQDMLNIFRNSNMIAGLIFYAVAFSKDDRLAFQWRLQKQLA
jgi:uncharacterized membrane protein YphA (DoxX/SURF4 family)